MSEAVSREQKFRTEVRRWVMRVKRPHIEFLRLVLNQAFPNILKQWHLKDFSTIESLVDDIVHTIERSKAGDHLLVLEGFQKTRPSFGTPSDQSYTLCRHDFAVAPEVATPEVVRAAEAAVGAVDAAAPVSAFVVKYDDDPFTHISAWMSKLSAPPLAELQLHTAAAQPGTMAPFPALVTMLPTPEGEWSPPASVARQFIDIASAFFREKFSAGQKCTFIVRGLFRHPAESSKLLQSSFVRESRFTIEAFARMSRRGDLESKAVGPNVAAALGPNVVAAFGVKEPALEETGPIPMLLWCPACGERHIDAGEFAIKPHHTHACQECGMVWRPALVPTCGVAFLPGYKNL